MFAMLIKRENGNPAVTEKQDIYRFRREGGFWYIEMPVNNLWSNNKLYRMREGAHRFLNFLSSGFTQIQLRISLSTPGNAGVLELIEHCQTKKGGAIYRYFPADRNCRHTTFWICDFALFIFGDLPDRIFIHQIASK
jgi:hypothetical protein